MLVLTEEEMFSSEKFEINSKAIPFCKKKTSTVHGTNGAFHAVVTV